MRQEVIKLFSKEISSSRQHQRIAGRTHSRIFVKGQCVSLFSVANQGVSIDEPVDSSQTLKPIQHHQQHGSEHTHACLHTLDCRVQVRAGLGKVKRYQYRGTHWGNWSYFSPHLALFFPSSCSVFWSHLPNSSPASFSKIIFKLEYFIFWPDTPIFDKSSYSSPDMTYHSDTCTTFFCSSGFLTVAEKGFTVFGWVKTFRRKVHTLISTWSELGTLIKIKKSALPSDLWQSPNLTSNIIIMILNFN